MYIYIPKWCKLICLQIIVTFSYFERFSEEGRLKKWSVYLGFPFKRKNKLYWRFNTLNTSKDFRVGEGDQKRVTLICIIRLYTYIFTLSIYIYSKIVTKIFIGFKIWYQVGGGEIPVSKLPYVRGFHDILIQTCHFVLSRICCCFENSSVFTRISKTILALPNGKHTTSYARHVHGVN